MSVRRDRGDEGPTVLDTITANPIPAALVAVGIGWLLMGGRSPRAYAAPRYAAPGQAPPRYRLGARNAMRSAGDNIAKLGHRVQDGASHLVDEAGQRASHLVGDAGHRASQLVGDAGHRASQLAGEAGHRVEELAGSARDRAVHLAADANRTGRRVVRGAARGLQRAEQGVESTFQSNPLALGAVAVAVGAAIGLSLPHTHVEDEWLGETKERLVERAQGVAGEAINKAEEAVGQLLAEKAPDTKPDPSAYRTGSATG